MVNLRKACSLCYLCAKNFHNRSKFDKVLTKNKFAQFFLRHGVEGIPVSSLFNVDKYECIIDPERVCATLLTAGY